jgi:hypothetical protein
MANGMQQGNGRRPDGSGDGGRLLPCSQADISPGAHLVTLRRGYLHHGIYVGGGRVVHYAGLSRSWRRGPIEDVSLERFALGRPILVKPVDNAGFSGAEVVARARSRLGEDRYRVASNNCEHFCEWCVRGQSRSEQVERLLERPLLSALRRCVAFVRQRVADQMDQPADTCAV